MTMHAKIQDLGYAVRDSASIASNPRGSGRYLGREPIGSREDAETSRMAFLQTYRRYLQCSGWLGAVLGHRDSDR